MTKLLILDMDGTVRHPISNPDGFILNPKDQAIYPEAIAAIKEFKRKGYAIVGASNQGGVAAGKKSLQDCIAEQDQTLQLLYKANASIAEILFCPDYAGKICMSVDPSQIASNDYSHYDEFGLYRKPSPGMLNFAKYLYRATEITFVGDRSEDELAAIAAKVQFIHATEWRATYWLA
jgi:D-glycero-D-manno-heptose 1,7-bisphosphate phosphatase